MDCMHTNEYCSRKIGDLSISLKLKFYPPADIGGDIDYTDVFLQGIT
jgi:hypothetical protein